MIQTVKLGGWKSRRVSSVPFYRCPGCGHFQDMIFWGPDELAECFACARKHPRSDFVSAKRKRTIVECSDCGRDVPLIPSNFGMAGLGYICSGCSTYVALCYGNQLVQPSLVLDVRWNPTILNRAVSLSSARLCFARCQAVKDYLVVQVLQTIVKEEDSRFLFVRSGEHWAGLLLDSDARRYLGFVVWTEAEYTVLRQVFIVGDQRRKGHAERLVKFWVERYADKLHEKFGIESPNEQALNLHVKLGHIKNEGDSFVGVKCFRVPGF